MTKDEALTLALEALEGADMIDCDMRDAINAIKEVLAQPERPWVGLTGQEKALVASVSLDVHDAVHRTDAKLKEKNT